MRVPSKAASAVDADTLRIPLIVIAGIAPS